MMAEMAGFDITSYVAHIEANRGAKDALMQKLRARRPPHRITVTDLTNLKQAYFRRKYPEITPPLEKQQLMWAGTGFHKIFGAAVSSEEYLEQSVEIEEIAGKIDIYEEIPIEVKTTSSTVSPKGLLQYRQTYIEQLGMYCAMVNISQGKIIIYQRQDKEAPRAPLSVYRVSFPDLEAIRDVMRRRRDLLIHALISNDPSNLPVCPWLDKGCDYSQVCDCRTTSVPLSYEIADLAGQIWVDDVTCQELLARVAAPQPSSLFRMNDAVFPRKAYFERLKSVETAVDEEESQEKKLGHLRGMDEFGFLDALRESLQYGAPGEVQSVPVRCASLSDLVRVHRDLPTILRVPKFQSLVERQRLPWAFPHYFLRLGFECALTGHARGRLLLYYANVDKEDAKLMVYDVSFRSLNSLQTEALRRVELLETASSPFQLPKCPSWMCRNCEYRFECGEA